MVRAVAMSAASALCLILAAGCASTSEHNSKVASTPPPAAIADEAPDANADIATLAKNLPSTLDGEIQRAQLLRSKGDYDEAARSFAQLLLIVPDNARVVGGYGKVLEQQGHSQESLAYLKRAVELDQSDWSLHSALGIAYDQVDDHASARAAYERALALKPGDATVLNNYAVSRMLAGDYASARRMFAEAEAKGVPNPKIALNLDKLASLNPNSVASVTPPKAAADNRPASPTGMGVTPLPVSVANLGAPAGQTAVPTSSAGLSPRPAVAIASPALQMTPAPTTAARTATAAPKALATTVVMEPVPADPLAGPTKHHEHPGQKLASAPRQPANPAIAKPAAPVAPPPALRTAADSN